MSAENDNYFKDANETQETNHDDVYAPIDFVEDDGIPVSHTDKTGTKHAYVIRSITGEERDAYLNFMGRRMKYSNGKYAGVTDFRGLQAYLLSLCLWRLPEDERVLVEEVQKLPSGFTTAIFERAQKYLGLAVEKEEDAKKE